MEKEQDVFKSEENLLKPILKPPKELLDFIQYGIDPEGALGHFPGKYWMEIKLPTFEDTGGYAHVLTGVFGSMKDFYRLSFDEDNKRKMTPQFIGMVLVESLSNAAIHGNKKDKTKNVVLGIWYGKEGVLFGVRDEGDFFSKDSTKKLIESRTEIPSTGGKESFGIGLRDYIYKDADKIFVDTNQNTLFLAISKEKFVIKK